MAHGNNNALPQHKLLIGFGVILPSLIRMQIDRRCSSNLAMVVFTNLGSDAGLICKPQLRPVTAPKWCEAVLRSPTNKAFTYNDLLRFHTIDLAPQFRKGNFDAVCCSSSFNGMLDRS